MKTIFGFILFLLFIISGHTYASVGTIVCHTPNLGKVFKLNHSQVTFMQEREDNGRRIASITPSRTKRSRNGFTQTVQFEGKKHTIHVDNKNNFSELNDYLLIRSKKGHEITYPIICKAN